MSVEQNAPTPRQASEQHASLINAHKELVELGDSSELDIAERLRSIGELDSDKRTDALLNLFDSETVSNKKRILFSAQDYLSAQEYLDDIESVDDDQLERVIKDIDAAIQNAIDQKSVSISAELASIIAQIIPNMADDIQYDESFKAGHRQQIDESLSEIRQHAERYMGKLQTAALAEAALDGVDINLDKPKEQ